MRSNVRTLHRVAVVLLLIAGLAACAPKTVTTSRARAAFAATQVMERINHLRDAAIQAEATGGLDLSTTRLIVQFDSAASQTLATVPDGWYATVSTAWRTLKAQLSATVKTKLAIELSAVDVILASFAPSGGH